MSSVKTTKTVEGPTSTVRTTTYESRSSYESEPISRQYKTTINPRTTIITRSATGPASGGSVMSRTQQSNYAYNMPQMNASAMQTIAASGVNNVKTARAGEKKDMQDLNERFASYIEKVRFLEAQNRKLADELDKLKSKWGKETTAIKAMYQAELDEARRLLDDAEKEKARLEIKVSSMEEIIDELRARCSQLEDMHVTDRETIEKFQQQMSDLEAEIALLRRRCETLENDRERDRKEIARLTDALNRARIDLDNETLNHIDAENRRQTLEEELEFLKQVHEQEMKELAALAYRDTTAENRDFWKNEMGNALREIQTCYDDKLETMKAEMENYYQMKMQEFRTGATRQNMETAHSKEETKRLKAQLTDLRAKVADLEGRNAQLEREMELLRREFEEKERELEEENTELKNEVVKLRAEMEAILKELQEIMDTKLGLELEIAAYRKLLEGEENRIGLRSVVGSWVSSGQVDTTEDSNLRVSQVVKGEMSAKTTYQRSAKGPVTISECSADGKYVAIENTGRRAEDMGNWQIQRNIDGKSKEPAFSFAGSFSLRPSGKCKIWAGSKPSNAASGDIEAPAFESWGIGANITTKLVNNAGEEKATHVQKTTYSS